MRRRTATVAEAPPIEVPPIDCTGLADPVHTERIRGRLACSIWLALENLSPAEATAVLEARQPHTAAHDQWLAIVRPAAPY